MAASLCASVMGISTGYWVTLTVLPKNEITGHPLSSQALHQQADVALHDQL